MPGNVTTSVSELPVEPIPAGKRVNQFVDMIRGHEGIIQIQTYIFLKLIYIYIYIQQNKTISVLLARRDRLR